MKVSLDQTVAVSFSLTHQPFRIDLSYGGHAIPEADNFTYLGVAFHQKRSWRAQGENIVNRVSRRMALLKRLAGSRWGCSSITLNLTYKLFILPILTYCCEPLIAASSTLIEILDKLQNQALRIIMGAVKTTPIDAMLVVTENRPLIKIF